jgi:hypothetical protein
MAVITAMQRFSAKTERRGDCLVWTGALDRDGYGIFEVSTDITVRIHRWSYEQLVGPIPDGFTIDHLCRNRACQNVRHMEPVTNRVNILRGEGAAALNARKTHCKRGHEFTPENTYVRPRGRECRACWKKVA